MSFFTIAGPASAFLALSLALAGSARAQGPELPPSAPPPATVIAPIIIGPYTCRFGQHEGFDDADARTTADLFCSELSARRAAHGEYDLRFGKLGSRFLFSVREHATGEERRVLLQSLEEVPVAAGRLVQALAEKKSLAETQSVDNVVSTESHKPKMKSGSGSGYAGLVGMSAGGITPSVAAGFQIGGGFRMGRTMLGGSFRAGGLGSGDHKLGFVSLDIGARYYLSDSDISGFFGGGVGVSYLAANGEERVPGGDSPSGSGFGAHLEGGVELFRSSSTAATLSLRADAPFYSLKGEWAGPSSSSQSYSYGASYNPPPKVKAELYAVPISLNFGFTFR